MKYLFITGHRKSGTTLLINLLDGLEGFCVYPTDIAFLYAYYPYFNNSKFSLEFKKRRLKKIIRKSLELSLKKNIKIKNYFNINIFVNNFIKKINNKNISNLKKIFFILSNEYIKYFKTYKKQSNYKIEYFVFKESSQGYLLHEIKNWVKDFKTIQIIRDPRDNFASLKSGLKNKYSKTGEDYLTLTWSCINRLKIDFEYIDINKKILKKKYLIVRFEDLTLSKIKTLKKISKFLEIKFQNKFLEPTQLGIKTYGNNLEGKKFKLISSINTLNWKNRITDNEAKLIQFYFNNYFKKFKYKFFDYKKKNLNFINSFYQETNKFFFKDKF